MFNLVFNVQYYTLYVNINQKSYLKSIKAPEIILNFKNVYKNTNFKNYFNS